MRLLVLGLLVLFARDLAAQTEPATSRPAAAPELVGLDPGDRFLVKRLKERLQVAPNRSALINRSIGQIRIEVLERLEGGGRRLRWTLLENDMEVQGDAAVKAIVAELTRRTPGSSFDFEIDAQGRPTRLTDRAAVIAQYQKLLAEMEAWGSEKEYPAPTMEQVLAGVRAFTDERTVEALSLQDASILLFVPPGLPDEGKNLEKTGEIANPLGGDPLPSRMLTSWEKTASGQTWLTHEERLDWDAALPIMRTTIEARALAQGQPLPTDFKLPVMEVVERMACLRGGARIPDQLLFERRRLSDGQGQVERQHYMAEREARPASPATSGDR